MIMDGRVLTVLTTLLFLDKVSSVVVPPPVNITVQCHNFRTVAYWNYSRLSLHPRFNVLLLPYKGDPELLVNCCNITHRHCDVSKLPSIRDSYYLKVTAVVGSVQSDPSESLQFTYNTNSKEEILCSLDFPSVNLSSSPGMLKLQFPHPFHFYKNALGHEKKKYYKLFTYQVSREQENTSLECDGGKLCTAEIRVPESQEKPCVMLRGMMNSVNVATAEEICLEPQKHGRNNPKAVSPADELSLVLSLVMAAVFLVVGAVFGFLVFRRKTMGTSAIPKSMVSILAKPPLTWRLLRPESDVTTEVLSVAPSGDPVQEPPQEYNSTADTLTPYERSRFPIGLETGHGSGFGLGQTYDRSGGSEQEHRSEEEQQESSDGRGVESSGYDRPHVSVALEISPGDPVQGYRPTQA
ncbi:hypothetical protein SKAU_G00167700 [Synaphobranchus kaupii]|uniref:Fibronectin type-III domain-containing protein n=1 Tax=Synaphobranchus kaupii TaxID=118154 RepID=A0A9Q1FKC2_SYNKA|nr:hypothetical protein SKAU_G00167700 [Synaphobranchus kaupii]